MYLVRTLVNNLTLPNDRFYPVAQTEVELTDDEFATIAPADLGVIVEEVSHTSDTGYQPPAGGIPATDLATAVQTSLGKADTAYQKAGTGIPKTDMASAVQTSLGKADTSYQKPGSGIPKTDFATAVQTSLGLADTSAQPADTPRYVFFSTTWPARGSSSRKTIYIGGSAAANAPTDALAGDVWIPAGA